MKLLLSRSEKEVIQQGCLEDCRMDARACHEYRRYKIRKGPLVLAHGSASLQDHGHHLLASVKAELVRPSLNHPNQGIIEFHVDSLAPQGGGTATNTDNDKLLQGLLKEQLVVFLPVLEDLCVVPGEYAWRLQVDLYILSSAGGNRVEVASRVLQAALQNTILPRVQYYAGKHSHSEQLGTNENNNDSKNELLVESDIQKGVPVLLGASGQLCVITVTVMKCHTLANKPYCLILDATAQEEACAWAQVHLGIVLREEENQPPTVASIQTVFPQDHSGSSSLPFSLLPQVTELAIRAATTGKANYQHEEEHRAGLL